MSGPFLTASFQTDLSHRAPGLREKGLPLAHKTDGEFCGGTPNTKLVFKAISQFDTNFLMKDGIFDWLDKKRAFMQQLRTSMPAEVFTIKAKGLRNVREDLLDKVAYYTSMQHFLREVEKARYPDVESASYDAFSNCKQKSGETVREYWLAFKDLAKQQKIDPSDARYAIHKRRDVSADPFGDPRRMVQDPRDGEDRSLRP